MESIIPYVFVAIIVLPIGIVLGATFTTLKNGVVKPEPPMSVTARWRTAEAAALVYPRHRPFLDDLRSTDG